ncbi:MAG: transaldolase [Acidimicrobiales bacterium]|nr:transaldolase [Acidimicrobiales bacterium]MDP6901251.1 transaldolase [Acidimicrobiales bacterium]HJM00135.1 transaldolase [Acidimicrobiales bacterium]
MTQSSATEQRLLDLHLQGQQSPWLDNLRRGWITSGELDKWVSAGIRGLTSNPAIFQKAIEGSEDYDPQFKQLIKDGIAVKQAYWDLVTSDIRGALKALAPVYESSNGVDGFVSVEVDPALARDTARTTTDARSLHELISAPNLMVKIPGTTEGLPSIRTMIGEGRSINVTLIFSVSRYIEVMESYVAGLEDAVASGQDDLSDIASVASFFISRTDTEVDRRLEEIGTDEALNLRGKTAVAQAQTAYQHFLTTFSGPRWNALAARGAQVQRPLWASTSTKNPRYSETLYVDELIGPNTVNTMPDNTIEAFIDHGTVTRTIDANPISAQSILKSVAEVGVDLENVAEVLEEEGVASFVKSFDELITSLTAKADSLM